MGYIYWDGYWRCRDCGHVNHPEVKLSCICGKERTYEMTYAQARAVARELNKNADVRRILGQLARCREDCERYRRIADDYNREWGILKTENERLHELQPCGHERRFVVIGDDGDIGEAGGTSQWCTLCLLEAHEDAVSRHIECDRWLDENRAGRSIEEATDETAE